MFARPPLDGFREIWAVDFASSARPGERPSAACLAAREIRSGRSLGLSRVGLAGRAGPPYPLDNGSLFVAFDAAAALGCHLALGWPLPARILDLHAEFRDLTNGLAVPHGGGLYGALAWHGQDPMPGAARPTLDALVALGRPLTDIEGKAILDHRAGRVAAMGRLLDAMAPGMDLGLSLLRGRYMAAVARMEHAGIPVDVPTLRRLRDSWQGIRGGLIAAVDSRFGAYDGGAFRPDRWETYLSREGIAWPRLASGALALDDDTFREMARCYLAVAPMRELRTTLGQLRPGDLAVGTDGRNRVDLRPFASVTGRNQPSSSRFIFGPACWLRGLIKPGPGRALAYVDWGQQEFGIAAALSGDVAMMDAYRSGDPYLTFAKQAGAVPPDGTKEAHRAERELFKACALGVQYGMGAEGLSRRIGRPAAAGRELLRLHRSTYPRFWGWSDGVEREATLLGRLETVFGWTLRVGAGANPRGLRNFPCQANGAEMLRLACCLATERGIRVVAPIHDALLIEGPSGSIDELVLRTQESMAEASGIVLDGFRLRSDARVVRWPDRYMDDRGREFWGRVLALLPDEPEALPPVVLPLPAKASQSTDRPPEPPVPSPPLARYCPDPRPISSSPSNSVSVEVCVDNGP